MARNDQSSGLDSVLEQVEGKIAPRTFERISEAVRDQISAAAKEAGGVGEANAMISAEVTAEVASEVAAEAAAEATAATAAEVAMAGARGRQ